MTLIPLDDFNVRGHPGGAYDVPETCSAPDCSSRSQQVHHCWPKSFLRRQPIEWVKLSNGTVIGNRLGFCVEHHNGLTGLVGGHKARLHWQDGIMWWDVPIPGEEHWSRIGPTKHQPPGSGVGQTHDHDGLADGETCPTCGHHRKPASVMRPGKLRPTKEWTVTVPDDTEIGADLLDEWVEDFAIVFGMAHFTSRLKRYHVLSVLRGVTLTMRSQIIEEVAEAAERRVMT